MPSSNHLKWLPHSKAVLVAGGIVALGMLLFPPWMEFYRDEQGAPMKMTHGYRFILDQPKVAFPATTAGMAWDTSRLVPKLALLGVLTFVAFQVAVRCEKRRSS
ncbi:MAG TPA: hypothetical protein VF585_04810 [Chthoniobacterales bacterium]|jgi:hypothetical protein